MTRFLPLAGLVLLAIVYLFSATTTFRRTPVVVAGTPGVVHLRFAHVTLHESVVAAYNDAIREYEALHPDVRVEQILVPLKLWASWLRTQMIGGTAPDIADMDRGHADDFVARYFLPLDGWTAQPNPYNVGTELEGVAWRDTFVDGLTSGPAYRATLQQVYGIPQAVGTVRVFANAELLRIITGDVTPPRDYAEFVALCERIRAYAAQHDTPLVPIAGSQGHALPLLHRMFESQTQRLALELNPYHTLLVSERDIALAYLRGDWRWDSPAPRAGAELMGEVGRHIVPGFAQLQREDSMFHFTQGRAVMLVTGSWEADTVKLQAPFKLAVFAIPLPGRDDPRFGRHVLGPVSELGVNPGNAMGVARASRHPEQAVDFLRFLTSRVGAERYAMRSNRRSSVVGVPSTPEMEIFAPLEDGWPAGFSCDLVSVAARAGGYTVHHYRSRLHELVGPGGSTRRFVQSMDNGYADALRQDLASATKESLRNSRDETAPLLAYQLAPQDGDARRASLLLEGQNLRELEAAQIDYSLRHRPPPRRETRSHPRALLHPKRQRRHALAASEEPVEILCRRKPALGRDVRDLVIRAGQQRHRALEPQLVAQLDKRLSGRFPHHVRRARDRETEMLREIAQRRVVAQVRDQKTPDRLGAITGRAFGNETQLA